MEICSFAVCRIAKRHCYSLVDTVYFSIATFIYAK
nr:MAG TPA: hypothetical protein [Crassvirales sp.]